MPIDLQRRTFGDDRTSALRLLISGGVHGDEFAPMAAIRRLIHLLDEGQIQLQSGSLTLIPVVNESAFFAGQRQGADGLDLARVCPGKANGSVTEQAAHALSQEIAGADYYIDLHTGGVAYSVLPLAGYTLHENPEILEKQQRMALAFNLPLVWGTWGKLNGRSLSVARDEGVPAIYTEYHGTGGYDPNAVDDYVAGCLNVMGCLSMIDREAPESRVETVLEDNRPESGHMQVCNPAPCDGFFEPAVRLGQTVKAGDCLGTVSDTLGTRVENVAAFEDGIVLTLRLFSLVHQGESVAVVASAPA